MTPTISQPTPAGPKVYAKKTITLLIGERRIAPLPPNTPIPVGAKPLSPSKQTHLLNYHDTVADILKFHRIATDGSTVVLKPATLEPYALNEAPYDDIADNGVLEVVPNRADQIGPFLTEADKIAAQQSAKALVPAEPVAVAPPIQQSEQVPVEAPVI